MSGDTAVPFPEPVMHTFQAADTEAVPDDGSMLKADQRRRVEALQVARQVIETKSGFFAGSKISAQATIGDLTYLASWILDGSPVDDEEPSVDETKRTWSLGYGEGAHAALVESGVGPERADEIKATLGVSRVREPADTSWQPGPSSFDPDPEI